MGRQHRVIKCVSTVLGLALLLPAAACSSREVDRKSELRRQLLRAENLAQKRDEIMAAQRLSDENGNLLESKEQIAGVTLPRGYKPKFVHEREWTYDGELPFNKLEQYFLQRLNASIEHPSGMLTRFKDARPQGQPNALPILVEVSPVPGRSDWSRIHIQQPAPAPEHPMSFAETQADIERKARYRN